MEFRCDYNLRGDGSDNDNDGCCLHVPPIPDTSDQMHSKVSSIKNWRDMHMWKILVNFLFGKNVTKNDCCHCFRNTDQTSFCSSMTALLH